MAAGAAASLAPGLATAWDSLGERIDAACSERQLPDPLAALGPTAQNNQANSALYVRALRSRLESLAYLAHDADEPAQRELLTPRLGAAIRRFQVDAGFSGDDIDGWAGPQTKQRLQQLVSFEDDQDIAGWGVLADAPQRWPAVRRAVYLRLYALGFLPWDQPLRDGSDCTLDNPVLRQGWLRFLKAARVLGRLGDVSGDEMTRPTLAALFAQDSLLAALAAAPAFCTDPANAGFVQAIGRVELWLLGYDIAIGPPPSPRREQRGTHGPHGAPHFVWIDPVEQVLQAFWQDAAPAGQGGSAKAGFDADFFRTLVQSAQSDEEGVADDQALDTQLIAVSVESPAGLLDNLKSMATSLWDGLKRAWGWLRRGLRRAWRATGVALWNLARMLAVRARQAFETVLSAIDTVYRECAAAVGRLDPASDPAQAVFAFAADGDARALLRTRADAAALRPMIQHLTLRRERLRAASRVLGLLVAALAEVLRLLATAAAGGWLPLLLSLSRIGPRLSALGQALQVNGALLAPGPSLFANPVR